MALSDNPFAGLSLSELQGIRTEWLACLSAIATAGQSYTIGGRQFTRAHISEVRKTLSEIGYAINFSTGTLKRFAQARMPGCPAGS